MECTKHDTYRGDLSTVPSRPLSTQTYFSLEQKPTVSGRNNRLLQNKATTVGLSQEQTARRRTQHNEAPFESDATNSMKGPIIVSEKDNRLFRPTTPPPFSGDSNMRLVGLCALIFRVSFSLLRFFSLAALVPLWKTLLFRPTTVPGSPRVSPHM